MYCFVIMTNRFDEIFFFRMALCPEVGPKASFGQPFGRISIWAPIDSFHAMATPTPGGGWRSRRLDSCMPRE